MDREQAQALAGWGCPGIQDMQTMPVDTMQDPAFLASMAAYGFPGGAPSQAGLASQQSSLPEFSNMPRMESPGGDMSLAYASQDGSAVDFTRGADSMSPTDAQLNLKRRISQLVQMRAMHQQSMFGPTSLPSGGNGGFESPTALFRAQSMPQLTGDELGGGIGDRMEESLLWKAQSQKDLQNGFPSMSLSNPMMSAPLSPRPPSRPPSGPPSRPPSGPPSGPPSRSPSGPPTGPPSRPPSGPPSWPPSTPLSLPNSRLEAHDLAHLQHSLQQQQHQHQFAHHLLQQPPQGLLMKPDPMHHQGQPQHQQLVNQQFENAFQHKRQENNHAPQLRHPDQQHLSHDPSRPLKHPFHQHHSQMNQSSPLLTNAQMSPHAVNNLHPEPDHLEQRAQPHQNMMHLGHPFKLEHPSEHQHHQPFALPSNMEAVQNQPQEKLDIQRNINRPAPFHHSEEQAPFHHCEEQAHQQRQQEAYQQMPPPPAPPQGQKYQSPPGYMPSFPVNNPAGQNGLPMGLGPESKQTNQPQPKPKRVRKPKPKVEKPPETAKISDLMASDMDRKLLSMFPQYQYFLDQNTKPMEDVMQLPDDLAKKAKQKRGANVATNPDGEPKKKKRVRKKLEGPSPSLIAGQLSSGAPVPLLAAAAAPMDTDKTKKEEEETTVAQILTAIKDKVESPLLPKSNVCDTGVTSASVPKEASMPLSNCEKTVEDPFSFHDDEFTSIDPHPNSFKNSVQESKLRIAQQIKSNTHKKVQGCDKPSSAELGGNNHESEAEFKSQHSQNAIDRNDGDTLSLEFAMSSSHPEGSQALARTTSASFGQMVTLPPYHNTSYHNTSTSLSSMSQLPVTQTTSSTPVMSSVVASTAGGSVSSSTTSESKPPQKNYIQNHSPEKIFNPLANLQASLQNLFDTSLNESNFEGPKLDIPTGMLNAYLSKDEDAFNSLYQEVNVVPNRPETCTDPGKAPMTCVTNNDMFSKNPEFSSTNYCPPHEIKPVPPSVPSALNQLPVNAKTDGKRPESTPEKPLGGPEGKAPPGSSVLDKVKVNFGMEDGEMMCEDLPLKPGSVEEELFDRLKNNRVEVPHCNCLGPNAVVNESAEGPYYTQLGSGPNVAAIRKMMEERTGVSGKALRIEKVIYSGREGKSALGCPIAKWIIRRSGPEEKYLCVCHHRPGHFCADAYIVCNIVAWEGVASDMADDMYSYLRENVTKYGFETERRCGTNERKTCACQGIDLVRRGASFSFGCSWSMYFNGCKFARSRDARKFRLKDSQKEIDLEKRLQNLATKVGPLYQTVAPAAHRNQCQFEVEGGECRLGSNKNRPFSGVTACVDFCAHAHKDLHNMNNGSTVVVTLTKHRGFGKAEDEQLHVLPMYILDHTDEHGSSEAQMDKIRNGSLEVLANYPIEVKMRSHPLTPKKRGKAAKKDSPAAKKKKEQENLLATFQDSGHPRSTEVSPEKDQKVIFEELLKHNNTERLSFENLMMHSALPGFSEIYGKFWDYFYANGTFPPGSFLAKWAANKMSNGKNQNDGTNNHVKAEKDVPNQQRHSSGQRPHHPDQIYGQHNRTNGMDSSAGKVHGDAMNVHNTLNHHKQNRTTQEQHPASSNPFSSPLDMLSAAAMMQNGTHNPFSSPAVPSQPAPMIPGLPRQQEVPLRPHSEGAQSRPPCPQFGPTSGPPPPIDPSRPPSEASSYPPQLGLPSGPPSSSTTVITTTTTTSSTAQGRNHPSSEHPSMQCQALPANSDLHSTAERQSFMNPMDFHNRAPPPACDALGGNTNMCNGVGDTNKSVLNFEKQLQPGEPVDKILDPTVVKCEWQFNEESFHDPHIGGIAIALCHGSVLFEVAKRELHATTGLKNPDRYHPTRISLVFYQHKNMNYRYHGWYENERKMEMLRQKKLEKMKETSESETPEIMENETVKVEKKKKKKEIDFSKTSAAQYKYMWDAPVRHGVSLTTDSIITRWIDPQPMVSGPYQRWV